MVTPPQHHNKNTHQDCRRRWGGRRRHQELASEILNQADFPGSTSKFRRKVDVFIEICSLLCDRKRLCEMQCHADHQLHLRLVKHRRFFYIRCSLHITASAQVRRSDEGSEKKTSCGANKRMMGAETITVYDTMALNGTPNEGIHCATGT